MDSLIAAAARALAKGDPLGALGSVALRDDPPALALRGTAMAQLGDFERSRILLEKAVRGFEPRDVLARARAVVALADVALATREPESRGYSLHQAVSILRERGDEVNMLYGQLVEIRRDLVFGRLEQAEQAFNALHLHEHDPRSYCLLEFVRAQILLRRAQAKATREALIRSRDAAARADIRLIFAEIDAALLSLDVPCARATQGGHERELVLEDVEALRSSDVLLIDACRRGASYKSLQIRLARRPVLFSLLKQLGMKWPGPATRQDLVRAAFEVNRMNESHRSRLRVEMGRLRRLLSGTADLKATEFGYSLVPAHEVEVCVLLPPIEGRAAELLALLSDGARWSTSMLALAAGANQRSVQRALSVLEAEGRVRSFGRGRAQRWVFPASAGFTTVLLLASMTGQN